MPEMKCEHEMSHAEGKHTRYQVCCRLHTELKQLESLLKDPKKWLALKAVIGAAFLIFGASALERSPEETLANSVERN
eukprot:CAMPEP_0172166612 /NCGR_PEP_ID=MMETSP1050-20130122/9090_1 /TAXON_ID=233186 /ORGANISM="Cryptomonas curvata, Strain CCAP979/52" /LENGTH=77 /DNA_ID=CAMNT_0012837265 /DNA_START=591 /DNA_END=821 /DNA_ORIENTATION=+